MSAKSSMERRDSPAAPRFRSAYGPRYRVQTPVVGESLTKQSFKDECDINVLMKRYAASGVLPVSPGREPRYVDATGADYQEAMFLVAEAKSQFMELPSLLRERFQNDPGRLLDFLGDDKNREEAIKLGLVNAEVPPATPLKVEVVGSLSRDPEQSSEVFPAPGPTANAGPGAVKKKS